MSVSNGRLLAFLAAKGEVVSTQYREDVVLVHCRIPQKYLGQIDYDDAIVTPHNAAGWSDEEPETAANEPNQMAAPSEDDASAPETFADQAFDEPITPIEAPRD